MERTETVATSDGTMEVFITHPGGTGGPFPVVVQLMDGIGMREELRDHARRTASWGYFVIAPDLYYRFGLKGPLDFADPGQRQRIMAAIHELTAERATRDVELALELASDDPAARDGKIGLYGFCMGGKLALELAQSLGERAAAAASIHPGNLVTEDPESPHRHLDAIAAELYFGIADDDANATPAQMVELERELQRRGIQYQLQWHPGALHGFMMPSRPELSNPAAAETVWRKIKALFDRTLK
ncbi:MAG: dienelactone hydrolase family protein [Novosphingobium sp.]|nr:dienelactone hydrolase family protein [Novosphingobium sp.]